MTYGPSDWLGWLAGLIDARCRVLNHRGNHGGPDIADLASMLEAHDGRTA